MAQEPILGAQEERSDASAPKGSSDIKIHRTSAIHAFIYQPKCIWWVVGAEEVYFIAKSKEK